MQLSKFGPEIGLRTAPGTTAYLRKCFVCYYIIIMLRACVFVCGEEEQSTGETVGRGRAVQCGVSKGPALP